MRRRAASYYRKVNPLLPLQFFVSLSGKRTSGKFQRGGRPRTGERAQGCREKPHRVPGICTCQPLIREGQLRLER
jgi:hypothetical protein